MASFRKKVKKELKKPDEFFSVTTRILHFIEENQKVVSHVLIAIIIISGMTAGFIHYRKSVITSGEKDLYVVSRNAEIDSKIEENIENFEKIVSSYSVSEIRVKAELELARLYLNSKKYDLAKAQFEKVMDSVGVKSTTGSVAYFGLANTLIQEKKWDEAIQALRRIDEENYLISKGEIFYALAKAYKEKGDSKNSLEYLKKLANLYPELLQSVSIPEETLETYSHKPG